MTHRITLTDDDYAALAAVASRTGDTVEVLAHSAIAEYVAQAPQQPQIGSYQYPTGEADSPEDEVGDEALAAVIGPERPWLSEMIIEDRGPR